MYVDILTVVDRRNFGTTIAQFVPLSVCQSSLSSGPCYCVPVSRLVYDKLLMVGIKFEWAISKLGNSEQTGIRIINSIVIFGMY